MICRNDAEADCAAESAYDSATQEIYSVPVSTIKAILFDADGVIQRPSPVRHSLWAQLLGGTVSVDAFLHEVFDAERACYIGVGDFQRRFGELLDRWNCTGDLGAALQAWTAIEVDSTILEMIAMLRASGHRCYLASNQEPYRARYMSETMLYKAAFDGEFYSCTVGHAKPAPAYFKAILDALAVRAEDTLFIDDLSTNVEAARGVGLRASIFAPAPDQRWHDHLRGVLANHGLRFEPHDS
jgi:putative hydrolase of the HAD superfamily